MSVEQQSATSSQMLRQFLFMHLLGKLPLPTRKFTGQTIIVTGANSGLGLEAVRHLVRLDAKKVIAAVRDTQKGEAAMASIRDSLQESSTIIEVWKLDLESHASVISFAQRVEKELDRLDVVIGNAGVYLYKFKLAEEDEETTAVNVVNTLLFGILLLPKLRQTSVQHNRQTVLTFTGSFVHYLTEFPEQKASDIFAELADPSKARMDDRYNVSKLVHLLLTRELAARVTQSAKPGDVVISVVNPGFVDTSVMRNNDSTMFKLMMAVWKPLLARSAEVGARTLIFGAYGGQQTHGKYLDHCEVGKVSPFVVSEQGREVQQRLWAEFEAKICRIDASIMSGI